MERSHGAHGSSLDWLLAGGALALLGDFLEESGQLECIVSAVWDMPSSPARHTRLRNSRLTGYVSLSEAVLPRQRLNDVFGSLHASHRNAFVHFLSTHFRTAPWA